ncbi:MAG: group II intron maturase-specific domain-containing protein [Firmicutes bacterium]|nr:group II intron maturase-specific domain-containing protein [Bacillota bacterium]
MGWINYFKLADMKSLLKEIDKWMRRRIRMIYWKQWKRISTKFQMLIHYGMSKEDAWKNANTRKSYWRISNSPTLSKTLRNDVLRNLGFIYLSDYYQHVTA